jgi:hypothetical protein
LREVICRLRLFSLLSPTLDLCGNEDGRGTTPLVNVGPLLRRTIFGGWLRFRQVLLEERPHPLHRDPDAVGIPDGVGPHHGDDHPHHLAGLVDDWAAAVTGIDVGIEQE